MSEDNSNKPIRKQRSPYADLGLLISVSVVICLTIKSILFEVTLVSVIWLLIAVLYVVASVLLPSRCKLMKYLTTVLLASSALSIVGLTFFDRPAIPKMVEYHTEALNDTVVESNKYVVNTPPPPVIDTTEVDSLDMMESDSIVEVAVPDTIVSAPSASVSDVPSETDQQTEAVE